MIVNPRLIKDVMREQRIAGVPRIKIFRNPFADKRVDADLVKRVFTTDGPYRLRHTDVTGHPTVGDRSIVARCSIGSPVQL